MKRLVLELQNGSLEPALITLNIYKCQTEQEFRFFYLSKMAERIV